MSENDYFLRQISTIIGSRVIGAVVTPPIEGNSYDDKFYGLKLQKTDGTIKYIWFLQDEECNGPGSFSIEDPIPDIDAYMKMAGG